MMQIFCGDTISRSGMVSDVYADPWIFVGKISINTFSKLEYFFQFRGSESAKFEKKSRSEFLAI